MTQKPVDIELKRLLAMINDASDLATMPHGRASADARDILIDDERLLEAMNAIMASDLGREALESIVLWGIRRYLLDVAVKIDEQTTPVRLAIEMNGKHDLLNGYGLYEHLTGFFLDGDDPNATQNR